MNFKNIFITLVIFLALPSCDNSSLKAKEPNRKLKIAVVPKGSTHEFWKAVHSGAKRAAAELDIEMIWKGPLKEDDREEQIKVLENFITADIDGIVLSPLDDAALRPTVTSAMRSGIPVVIFDSGLKGDDYISFVATDNTQGGVIAAEYIAKILNNKGKVAMLRYSEGSNSTKDREEGFMKRIADFPEIQIVSSNQYTGVTTEGAYKASENMLAPFKTAEGGVAIDAIFTPCEPVAFGMLRALEDSNLVGKVKLIGFDSTAKMAKALEDGKIEALVLQNPPLMGELGVKKIVAYLKGEKVEKRIDTGITLINRENMSLPASQNLLYPKF